MTVTFSRYLRRVMARLLVGLLVYAQMALAGYVCVEPSHLARNGTMPASVTPFAPGATSAAAAFDSRMDAPQAGMCAAHCQSARQNLDVKPFAGPALALLAGYFTLEPVISGLGVERPVSPATAPPPLADPPHAILHCCMRN